MLLFLLWLCSLSVVAQTTEPWTISGKVIDARTQKPIPHVSVTDRTFGTVTNDAGEFTLKLDSAPAMLTFSCIGYRTQQLPTASLSKGRGEIVMTPTSVVLDEVVVRGADNPKALVEEAIRKIDVNYPQTSDLLHGFYRETTQKRQRFISVAEGVVDVFKSPYYKNDWRDGVVILKGRRLMSQHRSDTLSVKLQGGPVLPVELDMVKARDLLLNANELNNYTFSYGGVQKTGDRTLRVVHIEPLRDVGYPLYRGNLYIDEATLAFTKMELEVDMSNPALVTQSILRKKPQGLRFAPREIALTVDYTTEQRHDTVFSRLNYIRHVIRFRCDWKRRLFKSNFTVVSEMVVTSRRSKTDGGEDIKPIKSRDTFNRRDNFYDKAVFFDDPDFWGNENIIEPTEDLLEGIGKIKKKLQHQ